MKRAILTVLNVLAVAAALAAVAFLLYADFHAPLLAGSSPPPAWPK